TLGKKSPVVSTINDGKQQLSSCLVGKICLLIVDDIWQTDHAAALDVLGPASRLLLTTRDAAILTAIGAKEKPLGVFGQEAALRLLAEWSGKPFHALPPLAAQVAESCGGVPLALALAGAQLHEGMECETLLNALEAGDLEFLDHPYGSIFKSMKLSVQALPEFERTRYLELVIFPEDAHVPERVIEHLWSQTADLTPTQTHKLLAGFARKSLLLRKEERQLPGISFHDLQHDFLRLIVPDAAPVHRQLVEGYRHALSHQGQDFSWSWLPDDETYLWTYLPYHCIQGNQRDELTATVKDLRFLGKKIWLLGANAVEGDIQRAIPGGEQDKGLNRLQRLVPQASHLLAGQTFLKGVLTTLLSRAQDESSLQEEAKRLEETSDFPYLKPRWPMPDVSDPAQLRTLEGHMYQVESCVIDPTGQWVVSGGMDQTLKVWDLRTGDCLRTLEGHMHRVKSCAIDPTGRWVVSGSLDRTLKIWDLATGDCLRTLEGHKTGIHCCAIDPTGG
ncbi:MAG: NB-ARC domain-containing protein, partial [Nitrospirota bacterium]